MPKFEVEVTFTMSGTIKVEAKSPAEAAKIAANKAWESGDCKVLQDASRESEAMEVLDVNGNTVWENMGDGEYTD